MYLLNIILDVNIGIIIIYTPKPGKVVTGSSNCTYTCHALLANQATAQK